PGRADVTKCVVTRETIDNRMPPTLLTEAGRESGAADEAASA
ncbi:MAG: hypothetical protein JWN41_1037, partial [Thermoleophilia bacterium]|nr:hypothetical protein [Thermoleophilia bacterium]